MLIAHFILSLFCNEATKKFYCLRTLTGEPLTSTHTSQYAFSRASPSPFFCFVFFKTDFPLDVVHDSIVDLVEE